MVKSFEDCAHHTTGHAGDTGHINEGKKDEAIAHAKQLSGALGT